MKTDRDQYDRDKRCDTLKQGCDAIAAVVLAGGNSMRMGYDKALISFYDMPLVEWIAKRLAKQVGTVYINRGQQHPPFNTCFPIITDRGEDLGPLGGIASAFIHMQTTHNPAQWLLSMPCDTPFFPDQLAQKLSEATDPKTINMAIACYNGRPHYAIGLWPRTCQDQLQTYLDNGGRSIRGFLDHYPSKVIAMFDFGQQLPWSETNIIDPFFNINKPCDVDIAHKALIKRL